jgi:hypothetical protein
VTSDNAANKLDKSDNAGNWVDWTRALRWTLALFLTLASLAVFAYWLYTGKHVACQVVTVSSLAIPGSPATMTTTQTCGLPDVTDFAYVLAAVLLLLIPDVQRLRLGGFEFERLSSKIDEQTREISQLRQTVSTTVNVGSDLIVQARNGFRQTKDILDRVRAFLPETEEIQEQLYAVDNLEAHAANQSWPELFAGIMTMHSLIGTAANASADAMVRTSEEADTAESEAQAEQAESVISDYLGDQQLAVDLPATDLPSTTIHDLPGSSAYPGNMTATFSTENGQPDVRMTPAAIKALYDLARPEAVSVARAIAAIGKAAGTPVASPNANGRQYMALVPADEKAPIVMYRKAGDGRYLVTTLFDRETYNAYKIAQHTPAFLQSSTFKAAAAMAAAAAGTVSGPRAE